MACIINRPNIARAASVMWQHAAIALGCPFMKLRDQERGRREERGERREENGERREERGDRREERGRRRGER